MGIFIDRVFFFFFLHVCVCVYLFFSTLCYPLPLASVIFAERSAFNLIGVPLVSDKSFFSCCFQDSLVFDFHPFYHDVSVYGSCLLGVCNSAQSCLTLCDPMNCSTPGLPVHHQLPEFTQTHVHQVGDAIQPSHPLSSPSPSAPNPSQHQSLFQ